MAEAETFGGEKGRVPLVTKKPVRLMLPRGNGDRLVARATYQGPLTAPVEAGREVGRLKVHPRRAGGVDMPLYTAEAVPAGTMTQRALDAALEVGTGWFRQALSRIASKS